MSCTVGVWTAYSSQYRAIFLDTEGLLGVSQNENRRTRLLLKVLAISDIVVYRTRAERLHNDLFTFLGDASDAYWKYFSPELRAASERCQMNTPLSTLGPSVVIFQETQHTELLGEWGQTESSFMGHETVVGMVDSTIQEVLGENVDQQMTGQQAHKTHSSSVAGHDAGCVAMSAEEMLRIRFGELGHVPKAFSSVEYVGTRTTCPPTDFSALRHCVSGLLRNNSVRVARSPHVVMQALQVVYSLTVVTCSLHCFSYLYLIYFTPHTIYMQHTYVHVIFMCNVDVCTCTCAFCRF